MWVVTQHARDHTTDLTYAAHLCIIVSVQMSLVIHQLISALWWKMQQARCRISGGYSPSWMWSIVSAKPVSALGSFYFPRERHTLPNRHAPSNWNTHWCSRRGSRIHLLKITLWDVKVWRLQDSRRSEAPRAGAATPTDAQCDNKNTLCIVCKKGHLWSAL